ncbi:PIN domain-containing protein [Streptomyces chattanoogensis]|uniref:PIN domain-containing protein n=1 Tax=Streptomyces chattanoogensis TaxID=66876 RepID=UPI00368D2ACF
MIIFDTNAVNDLDPHGSKADLLRLLREAGLEIAVPWVVLEELTAHKLYEYQRLFDMMRRRHQELSQLEPNLAGPPPKFQGDRFADHWRRQYADIFTTLPTSQKALQQAVLREAACMKPAKADKSKKSGGRDVAVWFSILEYLDRNPGKEVHFVSANTSDFGEPGHWPFPLDLDLGEKSSRLIQLLEFEESLEKFTQPAEAPQGIHDLLSARLVKGETVSMVNREIWKRHIRRLVALNLKEKPHDFTLRVAFHSMEPVECRRVKDSIWYWSKVTWQAYALWPGGTVPLAASWDTSILFPQDESGKVSLLRSGRLTEISVDGLSEEMRSELDDELVRRESQILTEEEVRDSLKGQRPQEIAWVEDLPRTKPSVDSQAVAFRYEKRVLEALNRVAGPVRPADGPTDSGIDAILETPEGTIGFFIKYGMASSGGLKSRIPLLLSRRQPDAVLAITNRPVHETTEREWEMASYNPPISGMVRWRGRYDDEPLERAVRRIRHRLAYA